MTICRSDENRTSRLALLPTMEEKDKTLLLRPLGTTE